MKFSAQLILVFIALLTMTDAGLASEEKFDEYEIRVIRPRFFGKANTVEGGAQTQVVMNQTFVYTLYATAYLSYHFSEQFAFEVLAGKSTSLAKNETNALKDSFELNPVVLKPKSFSLGKFHWTPLYGKFQLESGQIVYFDTAVNIGGGLTGIEFSYDHCQDGTSNSDNSEKSYPTIAAGIGQRFYLNRKIAIRAGIDYSRINYNANGYSCNSISEPRNNSATLEVVLVGVGFSYFFK